MQQFLNDVRSGVRMLVTYPTLSVVSILTLGLGIGLSTTVFCVVNGGLFKGLPFPEANRVVSLVATNPAQNQMRQPIGAHDLPAWQARLTAFEHLGPFSVATMNLSAEEGRPERVGVGMLTVEAFEAIGVQPRAGRGFREGDDGPGAEPIVLLGHDLWRERFNSDPNIVGRTVRANGVHRLVVGVMPPGFGFPLREALWAPLVVEPLAVPRGQGRTYQMIGRLKPGVPLAEASAQAAAIAAQLEQEFPATNRGVGADVLPYARTVLGSEVYGVFYTMLAAGIGVLLIACVNVSNLLAARASLRQREVAIRMALGASRQLIVRQHLTEVLVLSVLGGALGILLSVFGMRWFTAALTVNPPPFWITFDLDIRVLLFVTGLIVFTSLAAGLVPALHSARVSASALKDQSRSSTSASLGAFSNGLVVAELTLSCGLLIASGLMIKSVVQLQQVELPFAIDDILSARLELPRIQYPEPAARIRFFEQLLPRLRTVPGVESASLSDGLPAAGNGLIPVQVEGAPALRSEESPLAREGIVTAGFFETFETPLIAGRGFADTDGASAPPVAIVNASFARTHFPGTDPLGRHLRRVQPRGTGPWLTIVGVAPDLLMQGMGNSVSSGAGYYIPIAQSDVANSVRIALRTHAEPGSITPLLRGAVASLDPDLAIFDVHTMRWVIERQTWFYTVFGTFFTAFGVCALLLAAAGLYGVVSFAVTQRTREMGVRSALGAQAGQLILLVMRKTILQLTIGIVLGLVIALYGSGLLQPILYRVNPRDAAVFLTGIATLVAVSLLATFLPARRVTKIDPVTALASE